MSVNFVNRPEEKLFVLQVSSVIYSHRIIAEILSLKNQKFCLWKTSRERHKSAPYLMLKNSKRTSKCQVFSFTVPKKTAIGPNWRAGSH